MKIYNDLDCCGMKHIRGMGVTTEYLDEFFNNKLKQHVNNNQRILDGKIIQGKLYQCTVAEYQWSWKYHKVMLKHGWKKVAKWKNNSGSIIRLYIYVPQGAERKGA